MKMRARGFTLVELTVVIMCAVILVTLSACVFLEPGGYPSTCRSNLKGIGTSIAMFKGEDKNAMFPLLHTSGRPESNIRASDAGKTIDELRANTVDREAAMQNVWMIIDKGLVTEEAFQCPSDDDFEGRVFETVTLRKKYRVGWQSANNFSYGMHFPYKSTTVGGEKIENESWLGAQLKGPFVIISDKNPSGANEPAVGVGPEKAPSNHGDEGQGYLMFSGAVNWKQGAENSLVNGDDIYTIDTDMNDNTATPAGFDDQYITRHPLDE